MDGEITSLHEPGLQREQHVPDKKDDSVYDQLRRKFYRIGEKTGEILRNQTGDRYRQ